jgi:hypothetical protein
VTTTHCTGWTVRRRLAATLGAALVLIAYGSLTGGTALLWSGVVAREGGYIWSTALPEATDGHALTSDRVHVATTGVQRVVDAVVGSVQMQVTPSDPLDDLFVGIARSADAASYLRGVGHRQVGGFGQGGAAWGWLGEGVTINRPGGAPAVAPGAMDIWLTRSSGTGVRTVTWPLAPGDWVLVVMRTDGGPDVSATVRTGARAPHLAEVASGMLVVALVFLSWGGNLLVRVRGMNRLPDRPGPGRGQGRPGPTTTARHRWDAGPGTGEFPRAEGGDLRVGAVGRETVTLCRPLKTAPLRERREARPHS